MARQASRQALLSRWGLRPRKKRRIIRFRHLRPDFRWGEEINHESTNWNQKTFCFLEKCDKRSFGGVRQLLVSFTVTQIMIHRVVPGHATVPREVEEIALFFWGKESISLPGFDIEQELIKTIRTWNISVRSTKELLRLIFTQIKMEPAVVLRVMKGNRFWLLPAVNLSLLFPSTLIVMQCDKKLLFAPHARDSKLKCKNILNCKFTTRNGAWDFSVGMRCGWNFFPFLTSD